MALYDQIKQRQVLEADVQDKRQNIRQCDFFHSVAEDPKPQAAQMRTTVGFTAPTTKAPPPKEDPNALFFDTVDSEPRLDSWLSMTVVSHH